MRLVSIPTEELSGTGQREMGEKLGCDTVTSKARPGPGEEVWSCLGPAELSRIEARQPVIGVVLTWEGV